MHSRKLLSYAIYTSSVVLLVYLLMTWMYFKDNTLQLTTPRLLLWFIILPLSLFGFILITRRHRKNLDNKKTEIPLITDKEIEKEPIESYQLFINASICLPEGSSWSEIVDNKDDLTVLSEDLSDFDGLPILVKPIESVITEQYPLYHYQDSSNFGIGQSRIRFRQGRCIRTACDYRRIVGVAYINIKRIVNRYAAIIGRHLDADDAHITIGRGARKRPR